MMVVLNGHCDKSQIVFRWNTFDRSSSGRLFEDERSSDETSGENSLDKRS